MAIEIISIGNELLSGRTLDTNAHLIAHTLLQRCGHYPVRMTIIGDERDKIRSALQEALARSTIVITTGGLGATVDDLTLAIGAELFHTPLVYDAKLAKELSARFPQLASLQNQATLPQGARRIPNHIGTASGIIFSKDGRTLIHLPGVPHEMRPMLETHVVPFITQLCEGEKTLIHYIHLAQLIEDEVDPVLRTIAPPVQCGIYPALGMLSVSMQAKDKDKRALQAALHTLHTRYATSLFSEDDPRIEKALQELFSRQKKTLSLAESCTGGMIAARLSQIPGASQYFLGGVVAYSNIVKEKFLSVDPGHLQADGAVSKTIVEAMARGALKSFDTDYSLAVSGIAGPSGGTKAKPVGTVWVAIAEKCSAKVFSTLLPLKGRKERAAIIEYTGTYSLCALWRWLKHGVVPFEHLSIN